MKHVNLPMNMRVVKTYEEEAVDEFVEPQTETLVSNFHDQSRNVRGKNGHSRNNG